MKTAKEIQGDIFQLVKSSELSKGISGKVYLYGFRPRDSKKEDAEVCFITATADQIQRGNVNINIYVADIRPNKNGVEVENAKRTSEIEALAKNFVSSLKATTDYKFSLDKAIATYEELETHQHFVSIHLYFEILNLE